MFFAIICFPVDDIMSFGINFHFLTKPFSCMAKNARKKINILKSFLHETKITFHNF